MKTIEEAADECKKKFNGTWEQGEYFKLGFEAGVEFVQRWIPYPSKEIPELNTDYLVKYNILGAESIDIMTFRNTKEIGQVFTKIVSENGMDGLQIYPVTHWRPIELK